MKNLILTIALAAAIIVYSLNKTYAQSKTSFGMKAGLTYMTLGAATSNGISVNYNYRPGFQGGFFSETFLSDNILFTPQILFTQKGGDASLPINNVNIETTTTINYIDIPLLFGFKVNPNLAFFVGPQFSLLVSQTTTATAQGFGSNTVNSTDGLKKETFGGNLGAGYTISDRVGVNLHYLFDLGHAAKSGTADTGERNSGFALTLGYRF